MSLSAGIVYEIRNGGSDTNGGGFKTGASGTDWTQQTAAQYSVTDGVTNGTTTITSATANFGTDVVGNLVRVSGGTGSIAGNWYEIVSRTNSTTIVVDRSTGLTTGTGATLKIGGAFATPGVLSNVPTTGANIAYLKYSATTYDITTSTAGPAGPAVLGTADNNIALIGYDTTRTFTNTDTNRPTIKATVGSIVMVNTTNHDPVLCRNIICNGNSQTSVLGFSSNGQASITCIRCRAVNCTSYGFSSAECVNCEADTCGTGFSGLNSYAGVNALMSGCWAHGCTSYGFDSSNTTNCVASGCAVGFKVGYGGSTGVTAAYCVAYGSTGDGFQCGSNAYNGSMINCISYNNIGIGFNLGGRPRGSFLFNCAYGSNTGGNTGNVDDATWQIYGAITLTADPFTNTAGNDFTLNKTAGGGAACRAAGFPGTQLALNTTGYPDIGAFQHQDPTVPGDPQSFVRTRSGAY